MTVVPRRNNPLATRVSWTAGLLLASPSEKTSPPRPTSRPHGLRAVGRLGVQYSTPQPQTHLFHKPRNTHTHQPTSNTCTLLFAVVFCLFPPSMPYTIPTPPNPPAPATPAPSSRAEDLPWLSTFFDFPRASERPSGVGSRRPTQLPVKSSPVKSSQPSRVTTATEGSSLITHHQCRTE